MKLTPADLARGAEMRRLKYPVKMIALRLGISTWSVMRLFPQAVKRAQPVGRRRGKKGTLNKNLQVTICP